MKGLARTVMVPWCYELLTLKVRNSKTSTRLLAVSSFSVDEMSPRDDQMSLV